MKRPLILGLSASLRNARSSSGSHRLTDEIAAIQDREALDAYLKERANEHLEQFVAAGREQGLPFDELYRNLKRAGSLRGLSNSEIALASALWGAQSNGADIDHIPLPDHFPANGQPKDLDSLKAALRRADGILLSTPVYFGDRGSLVQQFIEMIRQDDKLRADLDGKFYAGLAVGAKRNGGQETTLIYALLDMMNTGLLGVGNDSDTTSQYGGTMHAGDIGTAPKDEYGINTCIGTGRRIASVAVKRKAGDDAKLVDDIHVHAWMLQDKDGFASGLLDKVLPADTDGVAVKKIDLLGNAIRPCIACDICPTHVAEDEEYRCIIKRKDDGLMNVHNELLDVDVIIPTLYSPVDRKGLQSVYQQFMERTRYLRRGDYVFTDRLVVPLIFAEIGANENLDVRVMTSMVRHHTVITRPVIAWLHKGQLINEDEVRAELTRAIGHGKTLATGNLASNSLEIAGTQYQPVGYVLAVENDRQKTTISAREKAIIARHERQIADAEKRLARVDAEDKLTA